MKMFFALSFFLVFSVLNTSLSLCSGGKGELIGPTRTLQEGGKVAVRLTVFSEPPGLNVFLDGSDVGKTPLWLDRVEPGTHHLRIEDTEKEVHLKPTQPLKVGLFKGSFIILPEEKRQPTSDEQKSEEVKELSEPPPSQEARKREDLTMWERFLNGTLPQF